MAAASSSTSAQRSSKSADGRWREAHLGSYPCADGRSSRKVVFAERMNGIGASPGHYAIAKRSTATRARKSLQRARRNG